MFDLHETEVLPRLKPIFVWQRNEDFHQHFWINKLISKFKAKLLVWAHHSSNSTLWIAYKLCQIFIQTHTCTHITFWSKFFLVRTHMINMQLHSVICTHVFRVHEAIEIVWPAHINQWFPWAPNLPNVSSSTSLICDDFCQSRHSLDATHISTYVCTCFTIHWFLKEKEANVNVKYTTGKD